MEILIALFWILLGSGVCLKHAHKEYPGIIIGTIIGVSIIVFIPFGGFYAILYSGLEAVLAGWLGFLFMGVYYLVLVGIYNGWFTRLKRDLKFTLKEKFGKKDNKDQ